MYKETRDTGDSLVKSVKSKVTVIICLDNLITGQGLQTWPLSKKTTVEIIV